VDSCNRKSTFLGRRCYGFASVWLMCGLLCLVSVAAPTAPGATGTGVQYAPLTSVGPSLSFTLADFDGDLRPDLADIQVGRSDVSLTDYWIHLQLSTAGHQTILVVAPSGGLQIAARDVNGDHALDLVLTTTWLRQPVAILLNDGHGGFSRVDPTVFPGVFSESKTSWDLYTHEAPDALGVPPESRVGICSAGIRLPHGGPRVGGIPPSNCGFPLNLFLISHQGRAPPSKVLHL
jgi:hypothetical protein